KNKIGNLWNNFYINVSKNLQSNSVVYGVYYNYESDMNGEFDVLAGSDLVDSSPGQKLDDVTLKEGRYLVFSQEGEMPQAVIDGWVQVWQYFSSKECIHKRSYATDFEIYKNKNQVDIYIGVL
ncbi:MAG: GyrI-like domain-containing protein, partial [Bdellovibrionaceae bacterium]|nr:GyrI-like domain-containing protein [Pseudobdellovibrionaceae bacterium]